MENTKMKKVEAIIRSSKFDEVREALAGIGVNFFTFYEVKGFGRQKGEEVYYRGTVYDVGYIARMQLEILTTAALAEKIVTTIRDAARTGEPGDGKIMVTDIEHAVGIRTGNTGESAL